MSKKKSAPAAPHHPPSQPQIFEATLGPNGCVVRGNAITQSQAEILRRSGLDVVICGPNLAANRSLARGIEMNANGSAKRCPRIKTRDLSRCHTTSPIRGDRPVTLSMKLPTERRPEGMMKFFTPELYLRYNSPDDAEADRADEEWENATQEYKAHLNKYSIEMNDRVIELAENLCLHDAELLSIQEDMPTSYTPPVFFPFPVATISLRDKGKITNLIYLLWSEIGQSRPVEDWPFSKLRTHWLFDELDVERHPPYQPRYWHRILWSDGRVISIPFFDVVIQSFSQQHPETAIVTKKRA